MYIIARTSFRNVKKIPPRLFSYQVRHKLGSNSQMLQIPNLEIGLMLSENRLNEKLSPDIVQRPYFESRTLRGMNFV